MEHRRRVPRRSAGWFGICHIEGESDPEWRDCQVADVSSLGLGITLHHFWPLELVGRQITVEAPAVGDRTAGGVIRVGIEFDGLTELELAVAGVLSLLVDRDLVAPPPAADQEAPDLARARPNA